MGFNSLLLLAGIWLLWSIHQDLTESNDRQRNLKTAIDKLANRFEQALEQTAPQTASKNTDKKRSPKKSAAKTASNKVEAEN